MMSSNSPFTPLDVLPFIFLGPVVIGLLFAVTAIVVRLRADSELTLGESQPQIDSAIVVLVISMVLSILGAVLYHYTGGWEMLVAAGLFLLCPVSAVLAILGRGVGRNVLLLGHGLIALWMAVIVIAVLIHG